THRGRERVDGVCDRSAGLCERADRDGDGGGGVGNASESHFLIHMKSVNRQRMAHHVTRAESFISGMRLLMDDLKTYGNCVGLLAVHSAISFADAVLVGSKGRRSNDQDH